jgi:hypothetical protein
MAGLLGECIAFNIGFELSFFISMKPVLEDAVAPEPII